MGSFVTCQFCLNTIETNSSYEINHFQPKSLIDLPFTDNILIICDACNFRSHSAPKEFEFILFLSDLMRESDEYTDIVQEATFGKSRRYRADILASNKKHPRHKKLLIECRSTTTPTLIKIQDEIQNLKNYAEIYGECQPIIAIPATLREEDSQALQAAGILLWDLDYLAHNFSEQLPNLEPSYFKILLSKRVIRGPKLTREDQLIVKLKACESGKPDWSVYQDLVGSILEHLFCPPLKAPLPEHSDKSKTNRRDFILPNYAENGFWHFLQRNYMADFLVVDAKNYTRKIGKSEILQVANYLKPQGAGLFGMIFSRQGCDAAGGMHTLREQWMIHRKLILVFNDEDVRSMLLAKRDGRRPEEVVEQKIEEFRLSI